MYKARLVAAKTAGDAAKEIRKIGVSDDCVRIMSDKAVFRLVKLHKVRNAVANIIKQDMLSMGADATVSQWTVDCSRKSTDVLLMGTLKHFKHLAVRMRMQAAHLPAKKKAEYLAVAKEVSRALGRL
ncbi:MAG: hypothetical protein WC861_05670 [Candidatus Micrarchaeia archaeon]|jgi:dihydropteroate synthase